MNIDERLHHNFKHHPPTEEAEKMHATVRDTALTFAMVIAQLPDSCEKSLALTRVEEAMFWANACVAREVSAKG